MKRFIVYVLMAALTILFISFSLQDVEANDYEEPPTVSSEVYGQDEFVEEPFSSMLFSPFNATASDGFLTFLYADFSQNTERLILNGESAGAKAKIESNKLVLTDAAAQRWGSAFNEEKVSLKDDRSFSTYFSFDITNITGTYSPYTGGDGLVFTIQTQSNTAGTKGGGLGYFGIKPSIGIEFDTFPNNEHGDEGSNHHVAVNINGVTDPAIAMSVIDKDMVTNLHAAGTHHAWIDYDGPNYALEIRLSNENVRPLTSLLRVELGTGQRLSDIFSSEDVYVGFTAATGGNYQKQVINSWYFSNEFAPIDTANNTYKQAPSGYSFSSVNLDDGTVELSITALNGETTNVPLTLVSTNGAVITPSETTTNSEGVAKVILSSPTNSEIITTITVQDPGGIFPTDTITIPGRSAPPLPEQIVTNATRDLVTVRDVPAGTVVKVYDADGTLIGTGQYTIENQGLVSMTTSPDYDVATNEQLYVTFTESGRIESIKVLNVAQAESSMLDADQITASGTTNTVTVTDVPVGATVIVWNDLGTELGRSTNAGPGTEAVISGLSLTEGQLIGVTIIEPDKLESQPVPVTVILDKSASPTDIEANATRDRVTVQAVPVGAVVKVYDEDNTKIGEAANSGAAVQAVAVAVTSLAKDQLIRVSITEINKLESDRVSAIADLERSASLDADDIDANATRDIVTIAAVPAGAVIKVYNAHDTKIGEEANSGASAIDIEVAFPGLAKDQEVRVTITEPDKLESHAVAVTAYFEKSASLDADVIDANATRDIITLVDVPAGFAVKVYDTADSLIGQGVNGGAAALDIAITFPGLAKDQEVRVTITEPDKLEGDAVSVTAYFEKSASLDADDIDANATRDIVTIAAVPAGAVIKVYDHADSLIGQGTNGGAAAQAIEIAYPGLTKEQAIKVSITEADKLESESVSATAYYEQSASLNADQIIANATKNTVTVMDVPQQATIIVYDEQGDPIGTGTNTEASAGEVIIAIVPPLAAAATIQVTMTEVDHDESIPTDRLVMEQSDPIAEERIYANATDSVVMVKDIPVQSEVRIYNEHGDLLGSKMNENDQVSDLLISIDGVPLTPLQPIVVTHIETNKLESDSTTVIALAKSAAPTLPDVLDIDVEQGTVTMGNVPAGTTVTIYDQAGVELGSGSNGGLTTDEVQLTSINLESLAFVVTYTETDKHESDELLVRVDETTLLLVEDAIKELEIEFQEEDTWESVTLPLFVVSVGKHNTTVDWTSSNPEVVEITEPQGHKIEARVHRQEQDVSVILTAKVSKNGVEKIRTFLVIVKALGLDKTIEENRRTVNVTGGEADEVSQAIPIHRISLSNGSNIDKAVFDAAAAQDFVNNPNSGNGISSVNVDQVPGDEADEIAVEIQNAALNLLAGNGNAVQIRTDYGSLLIEAAEVARMNDQYLDLFFRFVPVKDEDQQRAINNSVVNDNVVRAAAGSQIADVIGSSLQIETNYSGYPTTLIIPFAQSGITVPDRNVVSFLQSLRIFIEHSDGEKVMRTGTVVYDGATPVGLSISIDKFSVFSIIQLKDRPAAAFVDTSPDDSLQPSFHAAYIHGYPDGTFRPEHRITRAEMAAILAANLGLTKDYTYARLYPDVVATHWAASYIEQLKVIGLVVGDPQGRFRPSDPITRAEMAMIAARWLQLDMNASEGNPFHDVADAHWAAGAIVAVSEAGMMIGFPDGSFGPDRWLTRAQAVTTMNRLLGRMPFDSNAASSWSDVSTQHWAFGQIEEASRDHFYHYDLDHGGEIRTDLEQ